MDKLIIFVYLEAWSVDGCARTLVQIRAVFYDAYRLPLDFFQKYTNENAVATPSGIPTASPIILDCGREVCVEPAGEAVVAGAIVVGV